MNKVIILFLIIGTFSCNKPNSFNRKKCCKNDTIVNTFSGGYIAIPNWMTPNDDGLGDFFATPSEGLASLEIIIYGPAGTVAYQSTDLDFQWDGVINGKRKNRIYSYKLSYETLNGASSEIDGLICSTPNIEETTCFNHCENCYTSGDLYSYNPNNPTEILNPPEFYNWTSLDNSEIKNGFCCKTQ